MPVPYTFAAALLLASVYVFGGRLRARSHRRWWVSIAGGVSVATVFIDLLPEISERQAEYLVAVSASAEGEPSRVFSTFRITAFAGYSSLIAYLLVHSVWNGGPSLVLYTLAMAFHLLLVDRSLAGEHYGSYESRGRWILALAVLAGWFAGILTSIPEQWLARITGFVCGGVIMNTLVVELPEGRGGRFWPFVLAAAAYSLVLIVVLG